MPRSFQSLIAVIVLPVILIAAIWLATPLTGRNRGYDSDGVLYAAMAHAPDIDPSFARIAPWCWRVLTPYVVSRLPFRTLAGFTLVAAIADWLCLILMYGILRACRVAWGPALIGMVFYAGVFWSIKFSFWSPAFVDTETQVFVLASLYATLTNRYWAVPFFGALGALQKEAVPLVGLIAYVRRGRAAQPSASGRIAYALALAVPPAVLLAVVRYVIRPTNVYSSFFVLLANTRFFFMWDSWPRLLASTFSGLGILVAVVLIRPRSVIAAIRDEPEWKYFLAISAFLLLGGEDKSRLFLYSLPAFVIVAARFVALHVDWHRPVDVAWLGATIALHFYLGHHFTPMSTFAEYVSSMVPEYAAGGSYIPHLVRATALTVSWWAGTEVLWRWFRATPGPLAEI